MNDTARVHVRLSRWGQSSCECCGHIVGKAYWRADLMVDEKSVAWYIDRSKRRAKRYLLLLSSATEGAHT